jgi:hypothetical protein
MAIVSVAIVMSFHLKSKPGDIGTSTSPIPISLCLACRGIASLICHRKEDSASSWDHILATRRSLPHLRSGKLYQDSIKVQQTSSTRSSGMEDTSRIHSSCDRHRGSLCVIPFNKCKEQPMKASIAQLPMMTIWLGIPSLMLKPSLAHEVHP